MVIASLAIFPTSEGISVSRYVREMIKVISDSGLKHETGGMSTVIEAPDMESLCQVMIKAHSVLANMGVKRIHIDLHVDHRLDREASIQSKKDAVKKN